MRRRTLLVVLSLSVAASCSPAVAQSRAKGKKKDQPRVLKEGDEVKVWLDPAETLRDPNLEKAGIVTRDAVVFPVRRQETPDRKFAEFYYDIDSYNLLLQAGKIGDRAGVDKLLAEGRALRLPAGTKLLVLFRLERAPECRARIVEGEHAGRVIEAFIRYLH